MGTDKDKDKKEESSTRSNKEAIIEHLNTRTPVELERLQPDT